MMVVSVLALFGAAAGTGTSPAEANIWTLGGEEMAAGLSPSVTSSGIDSSLQLTSEITSIKVEISCTGIALENINLTSGGSVSSGKAKLSGCTTKLNGIKQVACEPHNGLEKGIVVTNTLGIEVISSGGGLLIRAEGPGSILATVVTSEECLAGEKIPVIGTLKLKDTGLEKESKSHLISNGSSELWLTSKTEEHKASLAGSVLLQLGKEHAGLGWTLAKEPANWKLNGAAISTLLPNLVVEFENKTMSLLVPSLNFELLCTSFAFISGGRLTTEGKITESQGRFSGCIVLVGGKVVPQCKPFDPVGGSGTLTTEKVKGLLALHEGTAIARISAVTGETMMRVFLGEECAFGEEVLMTGAASFTDSSLATEATSHLVVQGPLTTLKFFGSATIDGSAIVTLAPPHNFLKWSGWPG